jgi:succinate-semialdehyde dehydrogenase/glutarate-semialdehyde dehydrogenase
VTGSAEGVVVLDPGTAMPIAELPAASVDDCIDAVEAARRAQLPWQQLPARERAETLRRAFELLRAESNTFAELVVRENGKALADARAEVAYAAEFLRWFSEEAVRVDGDYRRSPSGAGRILVSREPVGVALLVTPWNFPAAMPARKIAPALAAGCGVVLKPAPETPLTAFALADLLERAGVPPGLVNVVLPEPPADAVAAVLAHPAVRKLSFTGSTEVGRALLREAAVGVVSCSMELGGNAPFIVFGDADLDAALDGAMIAKLRNGGSACTAANRIYVEAPIAAEFAERLAGRMEALTVGPGMEPGVDIGPLVSAEGREKVAGLVDDALDRGARLVTGGRHGGGDGFFYEPTVLAEVPEDAALLRTEIFGPVAPVIAFDEAEAVVAAANDTEYGLVAYVYTERLTRALDVADALEFGMVGINRGLVSDPAAPFGGTKHSGLGREGAHDGLLEFLETKYIALPGLAPTSDPEIHDEPG